jgi:hypothetical protein
MPRKITFEGATYTFPDDATDDEVAAALDGAHPAGPDPKPAPASTGGGIGDLVAGALSRAESAAGGLVERAAEKVGLGPKGPSPYQQSSDLDAQMRGVPAAPVTSKPQEGGERRSGALAGLFGVADQGVRGVAQGAATMAGLPVDLTTMALNLTPGVAQLRTALGLSPNISKPFLGSDFNKSALDTANDATITGINRATGANLDLPVREGDNPIERGVNRIGQEIGAAALPAGAAIGKAAQVGMEGARAIQNPIARHFVEQAAANPSKFLGREVGAAGVAGAGAAGVNELTRAAGVDEHGVGHAAGDLAGALGALSLYGIGSHAVSKVGDVYGAITGSDRFANQVVRDAVVDRLATAAGAPTVTVGKRDVFDTADIVSAIERGRANPIGDTVPGYQDTLADVTRNPGIASTEYGRRNSGSVPLAQRGAQNESAVNNAIDALAPEGQAGALRERLADWRGQLQTGASAEAQAAQTRFEEAAGRLQAQMHPDARGQDIRAALEDAKAAARDLERGAWDGVSNGSADIRPLVERFGTITDGLSEAERQVFIFGHHGQGHITGIPQRFLPADGRAGAEAAVGPSRAGLNGLSGDERAMGENLFRDHPTAPETSPAPTPQSASEPVNVPLSEATGVRSALTDAQREAASVGQVNKARVIGRYVDAIDSYFAEHHPDVEAYNAARDYSRQLNDRFTRPQTDVAQVLDRNQGMYRQADASVPGRFARPDSADQGGFEALMREAGTDPRARNAVADQLREAAAGAQTPEAVTRFMEEHSRVLDQFPELRTQLETRARTQQSAGLAEERRTGLERELGTENARGTSAVGKYLHYGTEQTSRAIQGVFTAAKPGEAARELLDFAGRDPAAVDGMRRAIWEEAERVGRRKGETTASTEGVQPWMPGKLKAFVDKPNVRAVLQEAYRDNPEHLDNLDKLAEVLQHTNVGARGKAPNGSGTPQGIMETIRSSVSPESIQSGVMSVKRGQIGVPWFVTSIAARLARNSVKAAQSGAINRMLDEALVNPDAAAALLRENNPVNRAYLARNSKLWGIEHADQIASALNDNEEPDPVKAAVKRSAR